MDAKISVEDLFKKIRDLESANQELTMRNRELTAQLGIEQNEKRVLHARIDKLDKDMSKLESQL